MDSITFSIGDDIVNPGSRDAWNAFRSEFRNFRGPQKPDKDPKPKKVAEEPGIISIPTSTAAKEVSLANVWENDPARGPVFARFLAEVERAPKKGETENTVQAKATLTCAAEMLVIGQKEHKADPFDAKKRELYRMDLICFHASEQAHAHTVKKPSLIAGLIDRIGAQEPHADDGKVAFAKSAGPTVKAENFKGRVLQTPMNPSSQGGISSNQLQKKVATLDEQLQSGLVFSRNANGEDGNITVIRQRVSHVNKLPMRDIMTMLRDDMNDVIIAREAVKSGKGEYLALQQNGVEHYGLAVKESDGRYSKEGVWHTAKAGHVEQVAVYENGCLQGDALTMHNNGMLKTKVPYAGGVRQGVAIECDDDGNQRRVSEYRNGRKMPRVSAPKERERGMTR